MFIDDLIKERHFNDLTNGQKAIFMLELKLAIEKRRKVFQDYYKEHQINEFICLPIFYEFDIHGTDESLTVIDNTGFTKNDMYD